MDMVRAIFGTGRNLLVLFVALLLGAALIWAGLRWTTVQAEAETDGAANQTARTHAGLLSSELQKFRLLPLVLQEYPDVVAAAADPGAAAAGRLNRTLEHLQARTDAAAIYVIAPDGRTVAASNWNTPASFVGQNYGFRPYFRDAMRRGASELFALGTVSGRPGLYLARRVERAGRPLGIVVVKVEFDRVEASWAREPGASVVTDRGRVILITSVADWRFRTLGRADTAVPIRLHGNAATLKRGDTLIHYRVGRAPGALTGSTLLHLEPLAPAAAAARTRLLLSGMAALLMATIAGGWLLRSAEKRRLALAARAGLEKEVVRRTGELRHANEQLERESRERAEVDLRYRAAREELAQANRLGSLGQITAGVAHEIAQPVAAIRAFAENGATFLDRGRPDPARENLAHIVQLTERIGRITAELRAFARRPAPGGTARLGDAIKGMLLLLGERTRGRLAVIMPEPDMIVAADRIRLEQVLINLVQNALDAIAAIDNGHVTLSAQSAPGRVLIRVADCGPGVDPAIRDTLFTPFTSAKADGLGLGLAIARDIARNAGGELRLLDDRPTTFELELPRA